MFAISFKWLRLKAGNFSVVVVIGLKFMSNFRSQVINYSRKVFEWRNSNIPLWELRVKLCSVLSFGYKFWNFCHIVLDCIFYGQGQNRSSVIWNRLYKFLNFSLKSASKSIWYTSWHFGESAWFEEQFLNFRFGKNKKIIFQSPADVSLSLIGSWFTKFSNISQVFQVSRTLDGAQIIKFYLILPLAPSSGRKCKNFSIVPRTTTTTTRTLTRLWPADPQVKIWFLLWCWCFNSPRFQFGRSCKVCWRICFSVVFHWICTHLESMNTKLSEAHF